MVDLVAHNDKELKECMGKLSGVKDRIVVRGDFYDGLKLSKLKFEEELLVEGDLALGAAFVGFADKVTNLNPHHLPARTYGGISVMDCHNVRIKSVAVYGGINQAVNLNDSYPEVGLKNITLEDVRVYYGAKWGIFMGGHNIEGIAIRNCKVRETCYGDTEHGIYLSGGHWNGDYPPVRRVLLVGNTVCYSGGRHGIQLNGRFSGVSVISNTLYHNEMAGLSLIGCQNVAVKNNIIYGNNKQGIVVYDYVDGSYWNLNDPEEEAKWKACHHRMENIVVENNTVVVPDHQWKKDPWHNNDPLKHPCIAVNSNCGALYKEFIPARVVVQKNVLVHPNGFMVDYGHDHDAVGTFFARNMMYGDALQGDGPFVRVPTHKKLKKYSIAWLEENYEKFFARNFVENPKFSNPPNFAFVDLTALESFDFGTHISSAWLYSSVGQEKNVGAIYPPVAVKGTVGDEAEKASGERCEPGDDAEVQGEPPWASEGQISGSDRPTGEGSDADGQGLFDDAAGKPVGEE